MPSYRESHREAFLSFLNTECNRDRILFRIAGPHIEPNRRASDACTGWGISPSAASLP